MTARQHSCRFHRAIGAASNGPANDAESQPDPTAPCKDRVLAEAEEGKSDHPAIITRRD